MNPLAEVCIKLSMIPVNGRIDNDIAETKHMNPAAKEYSLRELLYDVAQIKMITKSKENVLPYEKEELYKIELVLEHSSEVLKLDLLPAHMMRPRMPPQLFQVNNQGELSLKPNSFFDTFESAFNSVYRYYLAASKMLGAPHGTGKVIESVTYMPKLGRVDIEYQQDLSQERQDSLIEAIQARFKDPESVEGLFNHFLINFISGMTQKNAHAPYPVEENGQRYIQNHFEAQDWPEDKLSERYQDLLGETSFANHEGCPAYISHYERLIQYVREMIESAGLIQFPIEDAGGLLVSDKEELYIMPCGEKLVEAVTKLLDGYVDEQGYKLRDLITQYQSISKS
ncbi:conserved hypothetical protein [Vibrio jasicida]|uniref:Uncharacterized protein n=1 Tax=Vibrio jasicida TaxID=766224 RepID=A0AAU9QQU5_9VIBR|nr:conserved hypothetical protein [Vibrio jasicida]CAH1599220.1 conserved hypothetical protein [Vibrio jasicida]